MKTYSNAKLSYNLVVEDKFSRTGGDGDGTTISTLTVVRTIFVFTVTVDVSTAFADNLNVIVWRVLVVWVWNQR